MRTQDQPIYLFEIKQHKQVYFLKKDTVAVNTPHSSCVSIVGAKPLAIDRVPHIGHLQWETLQQIHQMS